MSLGTALWRFKTKSSGMKPLLHNARSSAQRNMIEDEAGRQVMMRKEAGI